MSGQDEQLFGFGPGGIITDREGMIADIELTVRDSPLVRPARVGFLAGMLSTWILGPGVQPKEDLRVKLSDIARRAISEAEAIHGNQRERKE